MPHGLHSTHAKEADRRGNGDFRVEATGGAGDSLDEKIYRAVRDQAASVGLTYDSDNAKY